MQPAQSLPNECKGIATWPLRRSALKHSKRTMAKKTPAETKQPFASQGVDRTTKTKPGQQVNQASRLKLAFFNTLYPS